MISFFITVCRRLYFSSSKRFTLAIFTCALIGVFTVIATSPVFNKRYSAQLGGPNDGPSASQGAGNSSLSSVSCGLEGSPCACVSGASGICVSGTCYCPKQCYTCDETTGSCKATLGSITTTCEMDSSMYSDKNACDAACQGSCDANKCPNQDVCTVGACSGLDCVFVAKDCDDNNPCTEDSCVVSSGGCQHTPKCNDGDRCTTDTCNTDGECSYRPVCNDNNSCTTDSCNPDNGECSHRPVETQECLCEDENDEFCGLDNSQKPLCCALGCGGTVDDACVEACQDTYTDAFLDCPNSSNTPQEYQDCIQSAKDARDTCIEDTCIDDSKPSCKRNTPNYPDPECDPNFPGICIDPCGILQGCAKDMCEGNLSVCEDGDVCTADYCVAADDWPNTECYSIPILAINCGTNGDDGGDGGGSSNNNSNGSSASSRSDSSGSSSSQCVLQGIYDACVLQARQAAQACRLYTCPNNITPDVDECRAICQDTEVREILACGRPCPSSQNTSSQPIQSSVSSVSSVNSSTNSSATTSVSSASSAISCAVPCGPNDCQDLTANGFTFRECKNCKCMYDPIKSSNISQSSQSSKQSSFVSSVSSQASSNQSQSSQSSVFSSQSSFQSSSSLSSSSFSSITSAQGSSVLIGNSSTFSTDDDDDDDDNDNGSNSSATGDDDDDNDNGSNSSATGDDDDDNDNGSNSSATGDDDDDDNDNGDDDDDNGSQSSTSSNLCIENGPTICSGADCECVGTFCGCRGPDCRCIGPNCFDSDCRYSSSSADDDDDDNSSTSPSSPASPSSSSQSSGDDTCIGSDCTCTGPNCECFGPQCACTGSKCTQPSSSSSQQFSQCGNNILESSEQCEKNIQCKNGYTCSTDTCLCQKNACTQDKDCSGQKQCKDGNCTPCTENSHCREGLVCDNNECKPPLTKCGNGLLEPPEQCDDGNTLPGDGCSPLCQIERRPICGNAQLEYGEQCDDGNTLNNDGCNQYCTFERTNVAGLNICGDGLIGDNEECDDANTRDFDGCSAQCFLEQGICGDGIIQRALNEQCEPSTHDLTLPYSCNNKCRFVSKSCGNNSKEPGEECDEGNRNSNLPNAQCRADCSFARCGDSILDPQEQCDDGNKLKGDGCDNFCQIENKAANTPNQNADFPNNPNNPNNQAQWPNYPNTQAIPYQLPLASLIPQYPQGKGPYGDTGPAAIIFVASGMAGGISWMRRRRM